MRGKVLLTAAIAAVLGSLAAAPRPAQARGDVVSTDDRYMPGTIVVKTHERRLYLVLGGGRALRYPVGVGRAGMQWAGTSYISGKYRNPAWLAPLSIRRHSRSGAHVIPGGSPRNPMGVAAMTLGSGEYAIHGTNAPALIGGFVSHGCIRMYNADIEDLYSRVGVGTRVVVTR